MAELAAELGAPGLRVFGDTIQPGASRDSTRSWVTESIQKLSVISEPTGVEVWLETHGDFASANETATILAQFASLRVGAVWDPANAFILNSEQPSEGAVILVDVIRHVHIKDLRRNGADWQHVLTGDGEFPLLDLLTVLEQLQYDRFLSFEWEKKWHPEIADAEVALPHFANWFRKVNAHA